MITMAPKVSIIIPIYNVAPYIADCLQSVQAQTYSLLEVILVNDATPDDSMTQAAPWIEKLQERFEVKVVNHKINRGLSAARNTGMEVATGDWIYFLDSDDEITLKCIELLVAKVTEHPDVDFVIGEVKYVGTSWRFPLKCDSYVAGNEYILHDYTTYKWYMMAWNRLYKKAYLQQYELTFKEGLLHEDELFSFQVATTARAMAAVYEETYIYKVRNEGSITATRYRLENMEDMLYTYQVKLAYMLEQYQAGIRVIPYTYGLELLSGLAISLATNERIAPLDKIRLLTTLKDAFRPLRAYKYGSMSLKCKLWDIVCRMPPRLILQIARWRTLLKSR